MNYLALDKLVRLVKTLSANGGLIPSIKKVFYMDTLKEGQLMGWDCWGNKYYENQRYMIGRSRWVEFNPNVKFDYNASQITPEWHGWIHYKTDRVPCEDDAKLALQCCSWSQIWLQPHEENMTGTECAFYPYSTTRPSVHVWDGCSVCTRPYQPESC